MCIFGLYRESYSRFIVNNKGNYRLIPDYETMDYIRGKLPFFFDRRAKNALQVRKSVLDSYDYNKVEQKLEYHLKALLERDVRNNNKSPLVGYAMKLYRFQLPKAGGDLLLAIENYINSFKGVQNG